ncbi:uncharacterized protein LOC128861439 [Anastrepha ludens]|uniref:uncharacterized protein LOC128861439 n=1 Tax=Anastrepha ludens TaxID=28586 RepID=UPI0023B1535D|nr:uncharacterized protein LOC128861439 [Anastrepha ludens]
MAPRTHFEMVILRISLESPDDPPHVPTPMTQHYKPPRLPDIRERNFLAKAIGNEMKQLPRTITFSYPCWNIITGDANLFKVDCREFDRMLIIFGDEYVYWMYYVSKPPKRCMFSLKIELRSNVPIKHCDSCLDEEYVNIMQEIRHQTKYYTTRNIKQK